MSKPARSFRGGFAAALLTAFVLLGGLAIAAPSESFLKGNEAYAAGDFPKAKLRYAEAITQAPDESVWFNLGNTCFRLEDPGHAALAYERALALSPGLSEAASNLRFVRQRTGARVADLNWLRRGLSVVPPAVAPWIPVGLAWLGFAWCGSALWRRTGATGVIAGGLLIALGAATGVGLAWWHHEQARLAIVLPDRSIARSEPSANAHEAEALPAGSRVKIISALSDWNYCELSTGARAWLPAKEIETIITRQP
jgi:tetratricopeptide (TPR) repeat protein